MPPENSDNATIQPAIQPSQQAEINPQQNLNQSGISNISTNQIVIKFLLFFLWSFLAIVILVLLEGYFGGLNQQRFTPREGFSFDFSYPIEALKESGVWLVIILLVSSVVASLVSKSVLLSRSLLTLIALVAFGGSIANYVSFQEDCEGLSCIGVVYSIWLSEATLIVAAGSVPILLYSSLKQTRNIITSKTFWLSGLLVLFGVSGLWSLSTSRLRGQITERSEVSKQEVQEIYSDSGIPVYEPTYFPPNVGKLGNEWVQDYRSKGVFNTNPGRNWESNYGGALEYKREYLYNDVLQFLITEYKLEKEITDEQFYQNDLNQLQQEIQESLNHPDPLFRKPNLENIESLKISNFPAIYYLSYKSPVLNVYRDGIRITIHVLADAKQIPKEEFIKVAESLKKVK